jgi:hypothetical protein
MDHLPSEDVGSCVSGDEQIGNKREVAGDGTGEAAGAAGAGGVFTKLSKEQLIEYIKKQKKEIKKLKADLAEELQQRKTADTPSAATLSAHNFDLFWELLDRRPKWQQRLARASLASLLTLAPALHSSARSQLQAAFHKWRAQTSSSCLGEVRSALEENKLTNAHLEQRLVCALTSVNTSSRTHPPSNEYAPFICTMLL